MTDYLFSTDRLKLRRVTVADTENLFRLDSDPEVMRYIRPPATDREQIVDQVGRITAGYSANPGFGVFAAEEKTSGKFIGWFCLHPLDGGPEIEVGYRLLPEFWGKGYATEMSRVLVDYGFNKMNLDHIAGITHPENIPSQNVLRKAGLVYCRDAHFYNTDVKYFKLTQTAYRTVIRPEEESDYQAIKAVNDSAFGQPNEGILVNELREMDDFIPPLSLVAEYGGEIVGHILFTIALIDDETPSLTLAPMAVKPEFQRKGIGAKLISEGLKRCREMGYRSVIVLGHPEYYPRFGFRPASGWNISFPDEVPDEAFMVLELQDQALEGVSGVVEYSQPFLEI